MNKNYKLSENETLAIIIVITINKLILNIPFYIIQSVGSGTLVNIIYIGLIDFIFLLLILKLMNKFENQDIKLEVKDLVENELDDVISLAFKYSDLVLGSSTYNNSLFPTMKYFIDGLVVRNYQKRNVGFI